MWVAASLIRAESTGMSRTAVERRRRHAQRSFMALFDTRLILVLETVATFVILALFHRKGFQRLQRVYCLP
jgi:hypothetical protein